MSQMSISSLDGVWAIECCEALEHGKLCEIASIALICLVERTGNLIYWLNMIKWEDTYSNRAAMASSLVSWDCQVKEMESGIKWVYSGQYRG